MHIHPCLLSSSDLAENCERPQKNDARIQEEGSILSRCNLWISDYSDSIEAVWLLVFVGGALGVVDDDNERVCEPTGDDFI